MRASIHRASVLFLLTASVVSLPSRADTPTAKHSPTALKDYVAKPEPAYGWKFLGKRGGTYRLELTSQTWQGITWVHSLYIFEPAQLRYPNKVLVYNAGGNVGDTVSVPDQLLGLKLAELTGARCAFLLQVPNQPLMDGKVEDDLITETYLKFLETNDPNWPLLFPMVKSVVKSMDAIQEFAKSADSGWNQEIDGFVVAGASKRGWTSWLSAVADKRVEGIAPMVIDTLNFPAQMKHQMDSWGKFSEQIVDYTRKGLVDVMFKRPDIPLMAWVDPYTYRRELTLPKLLICGTNDRYWVVDAMTLYWDGLVGPKYALYIPNAGHDLNGGIDTVMASVSAFFQQVVTKVPLPEPKWSYEERPDAVTLKVDASVAPKEVLLWSTTADTKDFRESKWESRVIPRSTEGFVGEVEVPAGKHVALYGELRFEFNGAPYSLCTLVKTK
ncbi:MAG: PhoPQ-activated protein PqaA family protein [Planctomycetota bacterium]